ncbi:lipocalin family protein [Flavivirga spongiicola]|uniref:Lipocalin family protein n=1 Tax=Flavivirga spongiicola TaxID=421621 RepID=A0ABU7XTJ5_9FLAO|nr:lipocalin family protein [Flavivirga sp. MEBiC05379]MDO5978254.1 lipocalin family protein [Flavivirga sp. MEBiC05379]
MKDQFLKPILAILMGTLLSTGCSSDSPSDDDNNANSKIEGVWKPIQAEFVDNNGTTITDNYSACEQTGRTTFSNTRNFAQTGYYTVTDCELEWDNTGNWQIVNDDILRITINGQFDNGTIGDYLITELTATTLKIDADTDSNSTEQEVYVFQKVN